MRMSTFSVVYSTKSSSLDEEILMKKYETQRLLADE
jgi:hypothetical protein